MIIFWSLRFLVFLGALFALIANWRVGLILAFALAADVFTYLWMAMPLFSVRYELALVLAVGLVVGGVISVGDKALAPVWLSAVFCASLLLLLRARCARDGEHRSLAAVAREGPA